MTWFSREIFISSLLRTPLFKDFLIWGKRGKPEVTVELWKLLRKPAEPMSADCVKVLY